MGWGETKYKVNRRKSYTLLTWQVFAAIFDPVIKVRHNGYDPKLMKHHTDLDSSKVGPNLSLKFKKNLKTKLVWEQQ